MTRSEEERDRFRAALAGLVDACDEWGMSLAHEPQLALEHARKLLEAAPPLDLEELGKAFVDGALEGDLLRDK
jgi:hypothetical protein